MKKIFVVLAIVIGLFGASVSCDYSLSSTPENVAKRDAKAIVRAEKNGDPIWIHRVEQRNRQHLDDFYMQDNKNGTDYCDRYVHAFTDYYGEFLEKAYK